MLRMPQRWRRSKKFRRQPQPDRRARRGRQADRNLVSDAMGTDTARAAVQSGRRPKPDCGACTMPSESTVHIAIELSVSSWLIAARLPGAEKSRLHRVEGGNTAALLALIGELRSRASAKLGRNADLACCFEAGRDGFWLQRLLSAHGIATYVLEPTSILVNRRARRAKTDRIDAEGMLRVLAAWLGGDRQVCSMVRVPTPDEEDAKRTHREREHLVQDKLRIENRIYALLFTQGIRARPSLRSWVLDMAELRTGDGRALPPLLRTELNRLLTAVVQEAYVQGISTRSVDDLVRAMGMDGISKSQVSRLCGEIDERVQTFLSRPIEGEWPYVWLDATYVKARRDHHIVSVAVIVAVGVNTDGRREVLGMAVGHSEAEPFWPAPANPPSPG